MGLKMKKILLVLIAATMLPISAYASNSERALLGTLLIYVLHKEINDQPRAINYHPAKLVPEVVSIIPPIQNRNQEQYYNCVVQVYDPVSNHYRNEVMTCVR